MKIRIIGPCLGGCGVILTMTGKGYPKKRCAACRRAHRNAQSAALMARLRDERIAAGECGRCGGSPIDGQHQCLRCAALNRDCVRAYREARP